jgi:adenine-specific DNA-methyltransferase
MTTDPGDLVLDPTCGSGTTAYVAEQWGRRWITMDTSRIALNIAKKRLISAIYPYYETFDEAENPNMHLGFKYKTVPHIGLKSLANNLPLEYEPLYDQPLENKKLIRVTGPFTVEALQSLNVSSPDTLSREGEGEEEYRQFIDRIFNNLKSNGIRNGRKEQHVIFHSAEHLDEPYLNARGLYKDANGTEVCVYFMIGPKFGTVSKLAVNEAVRAFRSHLEESSWLVILGFSFEDTIDSGERSDLNFGTFQVSKVRMSDDLLQDGLLKKDKTAGSFIIIGEPDVELVKEDDNHYRVEIQGMDMYDPVKDQVKARNAEDIAYWEMDDDYSDAIFKVRSIHFSGGDRKEFANWRKGLDTVARDLAKRRVERTLRMVFDEDLWDRLYTLKSEPIEYRPGRKIAVRVVSQFGEEATRILEMK